MQKKLTIINKSASIFVLLALTVGSFGVTAIAQADTTPANTNPAAAITSTNFSPRPSVTLTTSASAGGTVSPAGSTTYDVTAVTPAADATITATPNDGYSFASWSGDLTGSTNPATLTMDGDKNVTANFVTLSSSPVTNLATGVTSTDATLNGTNGPADASGHSFWVSTATFDTSSATLPTNVYSTVDLGAISANTDFSALLSSVSGLPAITPNTTYYFAAWSNVGGTWYPGAIQTFTTTPVVLAGTLVAQDFGVMNVSNVKGYTAGFGLTNATLAGATSVVTQLYSGTTLLQTDTAIIPKFNTDITGTQFSSPFDVFGTFDYAGDGYWTNVRGSEYGQTLIPTSVVATVTLANDQVLTATNTNLTGDPTTIFPTPVVVGNVATNPATVITSTDATLNGTNGSADASGHSFWVSLTPFVTTSSTIPVGVYSTIDLGAIAANATFAAPLSSATGLPVVTTDTTYYFAAWSNVGGTWYPGAVMSFVTGPTGTGGTIGGTVTGGAPYGVLGVTSITTVNNTATADGSFSDGWKYLFNITVPTNEPNLAMKFADWALTGGTGTIPVANNIRISSTQADNSDATVLLTAADTYSTPTLHMTGDLDSTTPGMQVQVLVETAIPLNSTNGSYTTNYGVSTN